MMPRSNNIEIYYNNIRDGLYYLVDIIRSNNRRNLESPNLFAETFFIEFFNELFDLKLINANGSRQNEKGIDLIDEENKIIVQVSSATKHSKIQESLDSCDQPQYRGYHFYAVAIIDKAPKYRKFNVPAGITFDRTDDVYDAEKILGKTFHSGIEKLKVLSKLVDEYFFPQKGNAVSRSMLTEMLSKAFEYEKQNNPSMKMVDIYESIFPMGLLEPQVQMDASAIGNAENPDKAVPFNDAIRQIWNDSKKHHLSLFGIGGLGKTVTLLSHKWEIPVIYIPLRNIGNNNIEDHIKKVTLDSRTEYWSEFVNLRDEPYSDRPNLAIILDGLNEINKAKRNDLYTEIRTTWECKSGVQLIFSSRYDVGFELYGLSYWKLQLNLLLERQITDFFYEKKLPVPPSYERIRSVLVTPLMLNLYVQSEHLRREISQSDKMYMRDAINAGTIIWNYLQGEIIRCKISYQFYAKPTIAAMFIAPYIAYKFKINGDFSISKRDFNNLVREAERYLMKTTEKDLLPEQIIDAIMEEGMPTGSYYNMLTHEMCLFYESMDEVGFMHQHFRDAWAALFIYQTLQTGCNTPDILLREDVDIYVESFLADLLSSETETINTWEIIWNACHENDDGRLMREMLKIYKEAFGNDLSGVDFSGRNLKEVPLIGFCLGEKSRGHFQGTELGHDTFWEDGHHMMISSLSWSPTWKQFISGSHDCTMRIWESDYSSEVISEQMPHKVYIRSVQWCPNSENLLVSAGDDQEIILWQRIDGAWHYKVLTKCDNWVSAVAWAPDGKRIVCGGNAGELFSVTIEGKKNVFAFQHKEAVRNVRFYDDGRLVVGFEDGLLCVWETDSCEQPQIRLHLGADIVFAYLVDNGNKLAVFSKSAAYIFNVPRFEAAEPVELYIGDGATEELPNGFAIQWKAVNVSIQAAAIRSYNNCDYCAVFYPGAVEVYKGETGEDGQYRFHSVAAQEINRNDLGVIHCAEWNQNCTELVFGSRNGLLWNVRFVEKEQVYDRILPELIKRNANTAVRCSAWNHDGSLLTVGYGDNTVRLWNVAERRCEGVFSAHLDSVKCVGWAKDEEDVFASGSDDGMICLWRCSSNSVQRAINPCHSPVNSIVWLARKRILAGTDSGHIVLWDIEKNEYHLFKEHENRVYSLLVNADETYLLSAGNDAYICIWDIKNGIRLVKKTSGEHLKAIRALTWGETEEGFFSASNDRLLRYRTFDRDLGKVGKQSQELQQFHTNFVYSVALSGNRKYIISGSTDSTVGVWDAHTKQFLSAGRSHNDFVWNISANSNTHNNCYVASSSSDGTLRLWDVTNVKANSDIHAFASLQAIPCIALTDCDFSGAKFATLELRQIIKMNGGIVEE